MVVTIESGGTTRQSVLPWPRETTGYFGLEESLRAKPMKAGETRTVSTLMPILNQIASVELRAVKTESTTLLAGARDLLRIESTTKLPGAQPIEGVLWADDEGNTLKSFSAALDQVSYRTTKEFALRAPSGPTLDLGNMALVRLSQPLSDPHRAPQITYRVHLDDSDPAKTFISDKSQHVTAIDAHTAEIVVRAVRPEADANKATEPASNSPASDGPADDDRKPSGYIQSDDPRIIAMAREAAGNDSAPWQTAVALERYVHDKVAEKNYSQTFATAADVAKTLEGDCTEHAVLLAALLRARGIPARLAIGLLYVPTAQAFAFHMWTEVWIDNQWIGLDGTLGLGGIGGGHLKLATSSLKDASAFSSFLPVAQVLGEAENRSQ